MMPAGHAIEDVIYTEGFPKGWSMVHRPDITLLIDGSGIGFFGGGSAICAAPKLYQGEKFLETAKSIAWALSGAREASIDRRMAEFCGHCGIGPGCDDNGMHLPNTRAERSWTCTHCEKNNERVSPENKA